MIALWQHAQAAKWSALLLVSTPGALLQLPSCQSKVAMHHAHHMHTIYLGYVHKLPPHVVVGHHVLAMRRVYTSDQSHNTLILVLGTVVGGLQLQGSTILRFSLWVDGRLQCLYCWLDSIIINCRPCCFIALALSHACCTAALVAHLL